MGHALVLHNGANIAEIQIDLAGQLDQISDPLYCLLQDLIRHLHRVREGGLVIRNLVELLIGNYDQRVHVLLQVLNTGERFHHTGLGLKEEGLGHNSDGQNPLVLGQLGDHRSRPCTGAAAHTAGDKYHIGALDGVGQFLRGLFRGLLADFRLGAGAKTLGQLLSNLNQGGSLAEIQCLAVRVHTDKVDAGDIGANHAADCIVTCSADTHNNNLSLELRLVGCNL